MVKRRDDASDVTRVRAPSGFPDEASGTQMSDRGPPLGVLGFCSSRLLARQRVRLLLGATTRGDVAEAPNPADGNFVDALRLRVPLECTAVFELEDIVARFVGMPIKLDDLRHK